MDKDSAYLRNCRFEYLPDFKYKPEAYALVYPLQKIDRSPAGTYGAFDVLGESLKDSPEAALLDELRIKRVPRDKYPATCSVTEEYEKIFDAKEEQAKKAHILSRLEAMDNFVLGIRSRIDEYMTWRKKTGEFCAKEKAAKPQLAGLADEFDGVLAKFDKRYADLKLSERTPAAAKLLIEKVTALIDSTDAAKVEKVKQVGRDTRTIGGSQDHAIGDFRMITRELRQRAGYRMAEAKDDPAFEFARQIRQSTLEVLQCSFGHEGAWTD
jgi:hypothetical protein